MISNTANSTAAGHWYFHHKGELSHKTSTACQTFWTLHLHPSFLWVVIMVSSMFQRVSNASTIGFPSIEEGDYTPDSLTPLPGLPASNPRSVLLPPPRSPSHCELRQVNTSHRKWGASFVNHLTRSWRGSMLYWHGLKLMFLFRNGKCASCLADNLAPWGFSQLYWPICLIVNKIRGEGVILAFGNCSSKVNWID